jgi:hypothetical protein
MEKIDYDRIIPNALGPKLAHHGFKYDERESYPPQGEYCFSRSHLCTPQRVSIGLIQYDQEDVEAVIARGEDLPAEVDPSLLLIQEPGFRLWLSNIYLHAVVQSGYDGLEIVPKGFVRANDNLDAEEFIKKLKESSPPKAGEKIPTWWEFHGEDDLRRVLSDIADIVVTDGLEWLESHVIEIRRHHEMLDRRRRSEKDRESKD